LIQLLLVSYVVTRIGKDSYGIVLLAIAVMGMVEVFGGGLSKAVAKHVASEAALGKTKLVNVIYSSSMVCFLAVGMLGAVGAAVAGLQFSRLFPDIAPGLVRDGQLSMFVMAGTIVLCLVGDAWRGLLTGVQQYGLINAVGCLRSVIRLSCLVAYFNFIGPALLPVVIIFASSYVLERVGLAIVCYRVMPELRASPALVTRIGLGMIVGFASFVLLATAGNILVTHMLQFVIVRELGLSRLTEYGIALTLMIFANTMVRSFVNVLVPVASKYQGIGDDVTIRKLFRYGTKYATIVALSVVGVTVPFLPALYRLWMGPEFVALCGITMVMFAGQGIVSISLCSHQILNGMGRVKFICAVMLGYSIVTICTVWLHLHFWQEATLLTTVAIVAIGRAIGNVIVLGYGMKIAGVTGRELLAHAIIKPFLVCSAVTALGLWIAHVVQVGSWLSLVVWVVVLETLFLGVVAYWCLDDEEKGMIMQLFPKTMVSSDNR
jgi:O-antigen/teichoic acid export membrane protein